MAQECDAIFHITNYEDIEKDENRIEYFQEDAIENSEIDGLNEVLTINKNIITKKGDVSCLNF